MSTPRSDDSADQPDDDQNLARLVEAYFDQNAESLYTASREHPLWLMARQIAFDNILRLLPEEPGERSAFVAGTAAWWFARQLAEEGWQVTLGEISEKMMELYDDALDGFEQAERIAIRKVDFCAMPEVRSRGFRAVLLMGGALSDSARAPQAIREASRIALPGALVVASARNKYAAYSAGASKRHLSDLKTLLSEGVTGWAKGYRPELFSAEELIGLVSMHDIEVRRAVSYPHFFGPVGDEAAGADAGLISEYLELEKRYAATPSLLGKGPILDVLGQKKLEGTEN